AAIDVRLGRGLRMRPAEILVVLVVERLDALPALRVRNADGRDALGVHGDAVGAWKGPEVAIEGAILLKGDHHVADLLGRGGRRARPWRASRLHERELLARSRCGRARERLG